MGTGPGEVQTSSCPAPVPVIRQPAGSRPSGSPRDMEDMDSADRCGCAGCGDARASSGHPTVRVSTASAAVTVRETRIKVVLLVIGLLELPRDPWGPRSRRTGSEARGLPQTASYGAELLLRGIELDR
ncbi:hypothetical protein GCM10009647_078880 [Streptomyces sanglieri]